MKVTIYTHNFAITEYNRYGYEFLKQFGVSNFGETDYRAIRINKFRSKFGKNKQPLPTVKRTYARSTKNGREFRFHIHCLDLFKAAVSNDPVLCNQVTYEVEPRYEPLAVDLNVLPKYSPKDEDQVNSINYLNEPGDSKVLCLRTGGGKMQPLDEPVLTPTGWKTIGDLKVGDYITAPDGTPRKVVGYYPQGKQQSYKIHFEDERTTKVGIEHLWGMYINNEYVVGTTRTMRDAIRADKCVELPNIQQIGISHNKKVPLDPWLYGLLFTLGMYRNEHVTVKIKNPERMAKFERLINERGLVLVHRQDTGRQSYAYATHPNKRHSSELKEYRELMTYFDIDKTHRNNYCLSKLYTENSYEVRKELFAGILDGISEKHSTATTKGYLVTGYEQAKAIMHLGRSLGYLATSERLRKRSRDARYFTYRLHFSAYPVDRVLVKDVTVRHNEEHACIAVDSPEHLYVTRDFIVTHNTYCSLQASADRKQRLVVSIESRFFNLWREALLPGKKQVLDLKEEEVLFVQGSKELCDLMTNAIEGRIDHIKVIVLAARTMANYFETYEKYGNDCLLYYPVKPINFYEVIQGGTRIKDELHLSYYANFVEELYLHGPKSFSLTATLKNGSFRDNMMDLMFPPNIRPPETTLVKYIDVQALMYHLEEPTKVKCTNPGSTDYNHNAFEKWILKDRKRTQNYVDIMLHWIRVRFLNENYETGQKSAIFVTSVNMATIFTMAIKKKYPEVKCARYAASAGDVYAIASEADILVTTVQSFGTGFDLEGLICCLMTTSINSSDTNIQVLGRLRELKSWLHLTPIFDYLVCEDIPRHIAYHEEKIKQFASRVKSHTSAYLNQKV